MERDTTNKDDKAEATYCNIYTDTWNIQLDLEVFGQ